MLTEDEKGIKMIYDCFTFFNELDLLEIRLNVLNDVVDKFVLVEATKTHKGDSKPLFFEENKERFKAFENKIIHIVVDEYSDFKTPWYYENNQRNYILKGLTSCKDDDIILISDLDEIPKPEKILEAKDLPGIKVLNMNVCVGYINNLSVGQNWNIATRIISYGDLKNLLDDYDNYSEYLIKDLNQKTTPTKVRHYFGEKLINIPSAGWHISYLGGTERIAYKLNSFAHQEFNNSEFNDVNLIEHRIKNGINLFKREGFRYEKVIIDDFFPEYIRKNQDKYKHLIATASEWYFFRKKICRIFKQKFLRPLLKFMACFIPVKKWRKKLRAYAE